MSARKLFKTVRIFILLMILIGVALGSWLTSKRSTDWKSPLWIAIYPINADNSEVTKNYITQLEALDFQSIEDFIAEEAKRLGIPLTTFATHPNIDLTIDGADEVGSYVGNHVMES